MYSKDMVRKSIQNAIEDAIEMEEKSTPSDKIYNTGAVVTSLLAFLLNITFLIVFLVDQNAGLLTWQYTFYPMLVFNIAAIYLSFAQVLRNRYLSATLSSALAVLNLIGIVVVIILQAVLLKQIYIVPFIFL